MTPPQCAHLRKSVPLIRVSGKNGYIRGIFYVFNDLRVANNPYKCGLWPLVPLGSVFEQFFAWFLPELGRKYSFRGSETYLAWK